MKPSISSLAALAAVAALPALAGVKYWDNPAFKAYDVGDYVQDGLVLHYDGIRNVGADAAHSNDSLVWNNLASSGKYRLDWCSWIKNTSDNKYYITKKDGTNGKWGSNGFIFDGTECFAYTNETDGAFSFPPEYTLQFAMTADTADFANEDGTGGYLLRPGRGWQYDGVAIRQTPNSSKGTPTNAIYSIDQTRFGADTPRANFSNPNPRYATVLSDADAIRIFETTEIPTAETGGNAYKAGSRTKSSSNNWLSFGAQYDGSPKAQRKSTQGFNGTLHAIRYYNNSLTEEQLAWNRVVDQNRFFGESAPIPVTNVVVATSVPGAEGDQPCGAYALDAKGYTFTAPAQRTINGKRYVLSGYTLQTWTGSDLGAEVEHDGNAYDATSAGKVRLTWQYERPAGEGQLVVYDENDYVQDGLVLHYDGICNQGAGQSHSIDTTTWVNLASNGDYPLTWCSYVKHTDNKFYPDRNAPSNGTWVANGFLFDGKSLFATAQNISFSLPETYTMQFAMTAKASDQYSPSYLLRPQSDWRRGAVAINPVPQSGNGTPTNAVYVVDTNRFESAAVRPNFSNANPRYATILGDSTALRCFEGTEIPDSNATDGSYKANVANRSAYTHAWLSFGSQYYTGGTENDNHSTLQSFKGTLHSIRYYNRALTKEELEQNREVDEHRFFSIPDVVVQSTYSYLEGYDKCGGYEVEGSYTFVAPATAKAKNIEYACIGYTVETQDANGNWGAAQTYEGRSYTYTAGSGTVRLTWKWKATQGLRSADDYGADDYAAGGLKVHLDGFCNQGIDAERSTTATKWINLGSNGAASDATFKKEGSSTVSAWTDDGYYFDGNAEFTIANIGVKENSSYTLQMLADIDRTLLKQDSEHNYFFSGTFDKFAISVYGKGDPRLRAGADTDVKFSLAEGEHVTYFTSMMDQTGASPVAYVFPGTTTASGTTSTAATLTTPASNNPVLGGWGGHYNQNGIGTIKNFRYYDRVLTEEELVRNRQVDSARYFGELGVTNVLVAVEEGSGIAADPDPGAYFVEGQYTFTATGPAGLGYKVFEPDGNGGWRALDAIGQADSFAYDKSAADPPPAFVKLEWRLQKPFTLIVR